MSCGLIGANRLTGRTGRILHTPDRLWLVWDHHTVGCVALWKSVFVSFSGFTAFFFRLCAMRCRGRLWDYWTVGTLCSQDFCTFMIKQPLNPPETLIHQTFASVVTTVTGRILPWSVNKWSTTEKAHQPPPAPCATGFLSGKTSTSILLHPVDLLLCLGNESWPVELHFRNHLKNSLTFWVICLMDLLSRVRWVYILCPCHEYEATGKRQLAEYKDWKQPETVRQAGTVEEIKNVKKHYELCLLLWKVK